LDETAPTAVGRALATKKDGGDMTKTAFVTARTPGDEEWHRLSPVERFEWLEEHCWILPPEERWDMKRSRAKLVHMLKERAFALACRRMAPGRA
jgi:hypothetical protein